MFKMAFNFLENSMLKNNSKYLVLVLFFITSCATRQKQVNTKTNYIIDQNKKLEHSFYLIGDAGKAEMNNTTAVLKSLHQNLKNASDNATVLFLGDNVYPKGIPSKNDEKRELAEHRLGIQIESVAGFSGNTIFIPGNHDWYNDGVKGLKRQQELVEQQLGKNSFLPKNGCPIKKVNISENVVLIIVDSHWYVTNWDKHPTINDNCEIRTRSLFIDELRSEIKKARGKTTLIAMHHPLFTNGEHGGEFSFANHMTPLPILGSVKNLIRETSGLTNTDLSNRYYNELKKYIVAVAQQNDKTIFVSGHEHNMQYIVDKEIPQIVSGSGSKTNAVRNRANSKFGYAEIGFAILNVYTDGSSDVRFISAKENKVEFSAEVLASDEKLKKHSYPILNEKTVLKSIYSVEETNKNGFYKFLWGERYRLDYSTPVTANVAYIDTLMGGLTPYRLGGGKQSKTLHLKANNGKRYILRSMRKQAAQFIQEGVFQDQNMLGQFDSTFSESLLEDAFTGAYPYSTFIIGDLADAANVAHLNPKLLYIPKQNGLGVYNEYFGDELCMFEEHPSEGHENLALISDAEFTGNILSTFDMMHEVHSNPKKTIDEETFIRARIFDMLIGDWDRHQDQWRWLEYKENGNTVYKPLPRDRDQAFSKWSDGFLLSTAVAFVPATRLFRQYDDDLKDVKGFNNNPFSLDKTFITNADKSVWDAQAEFIQTHITDEVIDQAFNNAPKEVNQETINDLKTKLKARRENLVLIAERYFKLIHKSAIVIASDKADNIKIEAKEHGEVVVTISPKGKNKDVAELEQSKMFYPDQTKEIWIYGLDDEDTFEVLGKSKKIKVRLIGGQNKDSYKVESGKNIVIYDYKSKSNDVSEAKKANIKLQDKYNINVYDYKKPKANKGLLVPVIGSNPDDGFKVGAGYTYSTYGFERNPFTTQHKFNAAYYFATNGFDVNYQGEFANIFGQNNFKIEANVTSPNFTYNFFGYGNETENNSDDLGLDYNRVKVRELSFAPSFVKRMYGGGILSLGILYESLQVDNTDGRFINNTPELPKSVFNQNQFAGASGKFEFENSDNKAYPTIGMETAIEIGYKSNIEDIDRNFVYLIPEISFAHKLEQSGRLVLATKLKSHLNFNNNLEFYQAATIGGKDGLRGFRNQRFTGKQSYFQNTDLRFSFKRMRTVILPIRLGFYASLDYGRVWLDGENSNKWHNSYGGGIIINGAELMSLNLGIFNSVDGMRVAFNLGFGL